MAKPTKDQPCPVCNGTKKVYIGGKPKPCPKCTNQR